MDEEDPSPFLIHDLRGELLWHKSLHWAGRDIKNVDRIVVHHTATELSAGQTVKSHIFSINRQHIENRGWPRIPYHYVIGRQGVIWQCNDLVSRTYHSGNATMNARSVGICLLGRMTQHDPTDEQLQSLRWLVGELGYPAIGHREVVKTACPGLWWDEWKGWVNGAGADAEMPSQSAVVQSETPADDVSGLRLLCRIVWSWLRWQGARLWAWVRGKAS